MSSHRPILLHLLGALILLTAGWYILHPHLMYYLDADSVAYMTIAQRYAEGSYPMAVNGMWSPLQEWLISPWMSEDLRSNLDHAQKSNLIIALGTLIAQYLILRRSGLSLRAQAIILWILAPVMVYFAYFQIFGDLLSVGLWLLIIRVLLQSRLSTWHLILISLLGAIAYLAKSYNFYYFPLFVLIYFLWQADDIRSGLLRAGYVMLGFGLMIYPWIEQLHQKYGIWTSSVSGMLNKTWYLMHHREYADRYALLIPPIYEDSPSFWEDPYWVQGAIHSATESWQMLIQQIARIIHTSADSVGQISMMSPLLIGVYILLIWYWPQRGSWDRLTRICVIIFGTLPLGYLLVHVESRYLWLLAFVGCILIFQFLGKAQKFSNKKLLIIYGCIAISYWAYPAVDLEKLWNKGRAEYELGTLLRSHGIHNARIISNLNGGDTWKTAYWSENQYYETPPVPYDSALLRSEILKYDIEVILYYRLEQSDAYTHGLEAFEDLGFSRVLETDEVIVYQRARSRP